MMMTMNKFKEFKELTETRTRDASKASVCGELCCHGGGIEVNVEGLHHIPEARR